MGALFVDSKTQADEIFIAGRKVFLVVDGRLRKNRVVVIVDEFADDRLVLSVHEAELAMLKLEIGHQVELGIGLRIARMHFVCTARVTNIEGSRVTLSRPSEAKKQPRRSIARVAYTWPVRIELHGGTILAGETCNISASGALIALACMPEEDLDLELRHQLAMTSPDGRHYQAEFKIVRVVREVERTTLAVQFTQIPERERVHLELQVLRGIARRYLRVAANIEFSLQLRSSGQAIELDGMTENASGGGALLRCRQACDIPVHSSGMLTLRLGEQTMTLADVVVLRVLQAHSEGGRMVVEFPNIDYELRIRLVEFLMLRLEANSHV